VSDSPFTQYRAHSGQFQKALILVLMLIATLVSGCASLHTSTFEGAKYKSNAYKANSSNTRQGSFRSSPDILRNKEQADVSAPDNYDNTDSSTMNDDPDRSWAAVMSFADPVDNFYVTRGFRADKKQAHDGLDLRGYKGAPIYAVQAGKVIYSGRKFKGYGNVVMIEHKNGWTSLYAHLTKRSVKTGAHVKRRQIVGTMGKTGRAFGVHLHFELMKNKLAVDPLPYLQRSIAND
jgi:murein DD-endopeptidase MepM/ murein hydrolase activator NlpD